MKVILQGADIFDGVGIAPGSLLIEDGHIAGCLPPLAELKGVKTIRLDGGILAPGFVDLQLNGGGGVMLGDAPTADTVATIARAHASLGATTILPTLITDTPARTRAAVAAVETAIARKVPGVAGLHLEGPHLSVARKGAHDPDLIRKMTAEDLDFLCETARRLPRLMVTLAPESASVAQVAALDAAGVIVSLGHTDAGRAACVQAMTAGAHLATHLFNAMSQLGNREPGLVGAVLSEGGFDAGLIADGLHVDPATIGAALRAKAGPGEVFLVSDAMAPAGSTITSFMLGGRKILRGDGKLCLADGTLAGADLDLARAIRVLRDRVGVPLDRALAMATSIPARVLRRSERCGAIKPGRAADIIYLSDALHLKAIWHGGSPVEPFKA